MGEYFKMGSIAVIKRSGVLGKEVVNVIRNHISSYNLNVYSENNYKQLMSNRETPDLLIVDINLNSNYLNLIDFFMNKKSKVITYIQNTKKTTPLLIKLFDRGLHGYFDFEMEVNELVKAIKKVLNGGNYIHPNLSDVLLNEYIRLKGTKADRPEGILTEREWEVLELIVQGMENDEIGEYLYISPTTVTNHVSSILRKLEVENRTRAASLALKNRWITL